MLIHRSALNMLEKITTDDTRYALQCVHVRADGLVEATDGHILLRVTGAARDAAEYPACGDLDVGEAGGERRHVALAERIVSPRGDARLGRRGRAGAGERGAAEGDDGEPAIDQGDHWMASPCVALKLSSNAHGRSGSR